MIARLAAAVLCALLLAGPASAESAEPALRSRVEGLLGAYRAVTAAEWKALGSGAAPVLEEVARDAGALPTRRARALAALGVVRPEAAAPVVRELAVDARVAPALRSAAVDAAPSVLGKDAQGLLVSLLGDGEPRVRRRAAENVSRMGAAGCRAVVAEARTRPATDPIARTARWCEEQLRDTSSRR